MSAHTVKILQRPERYVKGKRLGRHVEHDPRSRTYRVVHVTDRKTTHWKRTARALDQGDLGACTANALVGCLLTAPFTPEGLHFVEADCVELYKLATRRDKIPGSYPPDDTGSSGLAAAKAAKELGWIASYDHAFGLTNALAALMLGPVMLGINWYEAFDKPLGKRALLGIGGDPRGGHEVELSGLDVDERLVFGWNSWGHLWGNRGQFVMAWSTLERLLDEDGDVVLPRPFPSRLDGSGLRDDAV